MAEHDGPTLATWEVLYSRFFNLQHRQSSSPSPPGLRPLNPRNVPSIGGSWLVAAAPAVLLITYDHTATGLVLSVSLNNVIYEEHFVSSLCFSWPQLSCASWNSIIGSRVVFVCFRNSLGQIERFAVRFSSSSNAQSFCDSVKVCPREPMDIGPLAIDYACENSTVSDFSASNSIHYRNDEDSSHGETIATHGSQMSFLTNHDEKDPLPTICKDITGIVFSGIPPTFSELLNACAPENQQEQMHTTVATSPANQNVDHSNSSFNVKDLEKSPLFDETLKSQIMSFMCDASFTDLLFKVDKIIDELSPKL